MAWRANVGVMTPYHAIPTPPHFAALLSGRGLDMVKIVAVLAMVVDHAGYIWFGGGLYTYLIGRIAFPLFCFAAAAAIIRLRDDPAHLYRQAGLLLLFALLTEPVSQLTRSGYQSINVLFTLALAMAIAPVLLKAPTWLRGMVYLAAIAAMALPNAWEFGFAGMLLPVALAHALMGKHLDTLAAVALALVANFGGYAGLDVIRVDMTVITIMFATLVPLALLHAMNAFYKVQANQRRILPRYALHIFYPLHMLLLWLIGLLFTQ